MSDIAVFIITHGDIAFSLKAAIEKIMGPQTYVYPFSNSVDELPLLMEKIQKQKSECNAKKIVAFVDLVGGSCWTLANFLVKNDPAVQAIGGVNMPMLVSFFTNIDKMPFDELIRKIIADGSRGIVLRQGGVK